MKCGIFALRAMVDQAREGLCYQNNTKGGRCTAGSALIADRDLENIMTLVFSGFSFNLHLAHHLAILSRSCCRYSTAKSIFLLMVH